MYLNNRHKMSARICPGCLVLRFLTFEQRKILPVLGLVWDAAVTVATTVFIGLVAARGTCTRDSPARYAIMALFFFSYVGSNDHLSMPRWIC